MAHWPNEELPVYIAEMRWERLSSLVCYLFCHPLVAYHKRVVYFANFDRALQHTSATALFLA